MGCTGRRKFDAITLVNFTPFQSTPCQVPIKIDTELVNQTTFDRGRKQIQNIRTNQ
jgi:hypothetical protein